MNAVVDFLQSLYNGDRLLQLVRDLLGSPFGVATLTGIVFAETGLLIGAFLPGDSLLFTIGVASGAADVNVYALAGLLMCAAIIGDNVGYFLGKAAGPHIFSRPKSRFFNPENLMRTHEFYKKYGPRAVVYARFVPIIRTCTPFISGVARMPYGKFLVFSLFGGGLWIIMMTTLGYKLGQIEFVRHNFEKVVIGVVFISILPLLFEAWKARTAAKSA